MITSDMLKTRQALPLDIKVNMSKKRIRQWLDAFGVNGCYIAFSGGKDSTVLKHLVDTVVSESYKYRGNVPAVFVNTGLEYPEIVDFALSQPNVVEIKPKMNFKKVLETYGYPVISKEQSQFINEYRTTKSEKLKDIRINGNKSGRGKISQKWYHLINANFMCTHKCCDIMKKNPSKQYEKETGRKPFIGTMASESQLRLQKYKKNGCNSFSEKRQTSAPLSFWTDKDIWLYILDNKLKYSDIYRMGYDRTGCMFCMFGVHKEVEPNRFQRMQKTHPKQWNYCINKLGLKEVLDYIQVPYEYEEKPVQLELFPEESWDT